MTTASTVNSPLTESPSGLRVMLLGWLLLSTLACTSTGPAPELDEDGGPEKGAEAATDTTKAEKKRKEKVRAKTREIEKKERALHVAQLELKLARRAADEDAAEHEWAVAQAALTSEKADRSLTLFGELEQPLKQAERVLSIDRASRRLHDARTDLAGILDIYEEETEASSKDEIIARHRRSVEFAERALAIEQKRGELSLRNEEQERERNLNVQVDKAKRGVAHEQHAREQGRVKAELTLMKKEHALIEIEEQLQDLRTALRKLKKVASE